MWFLPVGSRSPYSAHLEEPFFQAVCAVVVHVRGTKYYRVYTG